MAISSNANRGGEWFVFLLSSVGQQSAGEIAQLKMIYLVPIGLLGFQICKYSQDKKIIEEIKKGINC